MSTTYTVDFFCSVDGYGMAEGWPGYWGKEGPELIEDRVRTFEQDQVTRLLHELLPGDGEVTGMLALMLLTEARRPARVSPAGELVPLAEQDRRRWDAALIAEGHALVRERLVSGEPPGRYQLLAAINAVHTDGDASDWTQVVALYDQLTAIDGSPIVRLNRALARAERDGPEAGLALVGELGDDLSRYHAYHAAHADLRSGARAGPRRPVRRTTPRSTSPGTPRRSRSSPGAETKPGSAHRGSESTPCSPFPAGPVPDGCR
jgi:predicted RNA polymerase sigma factor